MMMMIFSVFFTVCLFHFSSSYAAMQDFCVADYAAPQSPAGYTCKSPANVTVEDFVYTSLETPGGPLKFNKARVKPAFVAQFPGLNGLGLGLARADLAVGGVIPLHTHQRASEMVYVAEGTVVAGFIDGNNKAYVKTLKKGHIMIVPPGLLHFQVNGGDTPAIVIASFNSENPGVQSIENSLFQSDLATELIGQTTLLDVAQIKKLKALLGGTN